jgi:hypothetical protein
MFGLLTIVSALLTAKEVIKEKSEPVAPKGTRFDRDEYWNDVKKGIGVMEQIKKIECGGYMAMKPASPSVYNLPLDTVVDIERYKHDKRVYGDRIVEIWRKNGHYKYKRKF